MIEIYSVTDFGQINQGDLLVIEKDNGVKFIAVARQVLSKGKPTEEIVICKSRNDYFIMAMMLDGKSWVKNVTRLPGVEVTSITNTMREFVRR